MQSLQRASGSNEACTQGKAGDDGGLRQKCQGDQGAEPGEIQTLLQSL